MRGKRTNEDLLKSPTEVATPSKTSRITRQTTMNCKICKKPIHLQLSGDDDDDVVVTCRKCFDQYHGACSGVSGTFYHNMIENSSQGWLCYNCNQDSFNILARMNDRWNTVVDTVETHESKINTLASSTQSGFAAMEARATAFEDRMTSQIETLKVCLADYHTKLENVTENTERANNCQSSTHPSKDLTYIKDLQRKNNLIVQNVPLVDNENQQKLKDIVIKLANSCGCDISSMDIVSATRLRRNTENQNASAISNAILVKFVDVSIKDNIFKGYIGTITNKAPITSSVIGTGGNHRIFVNQHLSPELMKVKMRAVKLKQLKMISKISANYNMVRIYKDENWIKIYDINQLEEIFPQCS